MISHNKKVNRLLEALACELCHMRDEKVECIHDIINDKQDGYEFNFISAVYSYRRLVKL